jgi:hypothetical protein
MTSQDGTILTRSRLRLCKWGNEFPLFGSATTRTKPKIRTHGGNNFFLSQVFSFRFSYKLHSHTHITTFATRKCQYFPSPDSLASRVTSFCLKDLCSGWRVMNTNGQSVLGGSIVDSPERNFSMRSLMSCPLAMVRLLEGMCGPMIQKYCWLAMCLDHHPRHINDKLTSPTIAVH